MNNSTKKHKKMHQLRQALSSPPSFYHRQKTLFQQSVLQACLLSSAMTLALCSPHLYAADIAGCKSTLSIYNTYACSGTATTPQSLSVNFLSAGELSVSTTPGFSVDVIGVGNNAIHLTNTWGAITYTDANNSYLYSEENGLVVEGHTLLQVHTNGSINANKKGLWVKNIDPNINTDIIVTTEDIIEGFAEDGIHVVNQGGGNTSILSKNEVISAYRSGIHAEIGKLTSPSILNITTAEVYSQGPDGIHAVNNGASVEGAIQITANGPIRGYNYAINALAGGTIYITLNDSTANYAEKSSDTVLKTEGGSVTLTNNGTLTGTVIFANTSSRFENKNVWNTAGGNNHFNAPVSSLSAMSPLAASPSYLLVNNANATIIAANQAGVAETTTFTGLTSFTNAGILSIQDGGVGDKTVINGHYIGQNGTIAFDTVLTNDNSATDKLVITGGSSGESQVFINNLPSLGGQTVQGVDIIEVTGGASGAKFTLANRVIAGAYEYNLHQGTPSDPNGNWYLMSVADETPITPTPNKYRADIGAYLGNQLSALNMFVHRLHDRGSAQRESGANGRDMNSTAWARVVMGRTQSSALSGKVTETTNRAVVHLGQEIIQSSTNGKDSWHIGLMGGAGQSRTTASTKGNNTHKGYGNVWGYSGGVYGSWFAQQNQGMYVDSWVQYSHYKNRITNKNLPQETYHSHSIAASIEAGYDVVLSANTHREWVLTPQAQFIYTHYHNDDIQEQNGTLIHEGRNKHRQARIGLRVTGQALDKASVSPFIEVNWQHHNGANQFTFGAEKIANDIPNHSVQLKTGLSGQLNKQWQIWGHIGGEWGKNNFKAYEGRIGLKYSW